MSVWEGLRRMFGTLKTSSSVKVVSATAVIALATPFIAGWEGLRTTAYLDRLANPPVWTACYGHTGKYAYEGAQYTVAQCEDILKEDVGAHYDRMAKCVAVDRVPLSVQASLLELMFNVGTGAGCKSTMVKLANSGQYDAACAELDKWVKAGGVTVRGLVNRRNASEEMCKADL